MKNVSVLIFVVLIVAVLLFAMVSFQVRETEYALVTRFGEVSRTITEPGFYFKLPLPIDRVRTFDARSHLLPGKMEETTTRGTEPITVTSYLVWKIADPQKYLETVTNEVSAESHLKSLLRDAQNTEIGSHYFSEFVNSDADKIRLSEIEDSMLGVLKKRAMDNYGIDIEVVGIKQLGVSNEVTQNVFERMQAERARKKETIIAQGKSEATKITSQADAKATQLEAVVEAEAKAIRGAGDAEAAKYYKLLESDPEFAMYLQNLEALKNILKERSTIILDEDTDLIELLKSIPDLKPKN